MFGGPARYYLQPSQSFSNDFELVNQSKKFGSFEWEFWKCFSLLE